MFKHVEDSPKVSDRLMSWLPFSWTGAFERWVTRTGRASELLGEMNSEAVVTSEEVSPSAGGGLTEVASSRSPLLETRDTVQLHRGTNHFEMFKI